MSIRTAEKTVTFASLMLLALLFLFTIPGQALGADGSDKDLQKPASLKSLQNIERSEDVFKDADSKIIDIRKDALQEAAISLGARGGLAHRTYQIRKLLKSRAAHLNKIFDFRQLLIPAPSGLLIEPPIISEAIDNMLIGDGGTQAAVADRVFEIGVNARIVSAPRTWNQYLERSYSNVEKPPQLLRPENKEERENWKKWVALGWAQGVAQADAIFEEDLARLRADYEGMVRYRKLLAQGMVSQPYALQRDRGITGGGHVLRVGDRSISLTGLPQLKSGHEEWRPASR